MLKQTGKGQTELSHVSEPTPTSLTVFTESKSGKSICHYCLILVARVRIHDSLIKWDVCNKLNRTKKQIIYQNYDFTNWSGQLIHRQMLKVLVQPITNRVPHK